jgi:hypothetical protein
MIEEGILIGLKEISHFYLSIKEVKKFGSEVESDK